MQKGYQELNREELLVEVNKLHSELEQLKRMVFGSKKERFISNENTAQLSLDLPEEAPVETVEQTPIPKTITYTKKTEKQAKIPKGRKLLPAHLPRIEVILEPEDLQEGMQKIGEEVTEELDYKPGELFVRRYVRPKYVLPKQDQLVIAPLPSRVIDKGIPGAGLLTQVLIDKYVDHLPCYRQIKRYLRESGVELKSSTICGWIDKACQLLSPLFEALQAYVLAQDYLQADETSIKVQDRNKDKNMHKGYFWVYYAPKIKTVFFDYAKGRAGIYPKETLNDYQGILQTDGYDVYDVFKEKSYPIQVVHCMAHARRYFEKALEDDAQRASYALEKIQQLYHIERFAQSNNYDADQRRELRQHKASPILEEIGAWLLNEYPNVLPKSLIGKAIAYALKRWKELSAYVDNGNIEIDNNLVENAIRPVALGRKNYLFAGSHDAAQRTAMMYSFLGTCLKLDIDPNKWLVDVLSRLPDYPVKMIHELLPHNWAVNQQMQN